MLRPGQRLVSKTGALWRWDGYTASADAPTPAAQRLAQKPAGGARTGGDCRAQTCRAGWSRMQRTEAGVREAVEQERVAHQWRATALAALMKRVRLWRLLSAAGQATRRAGLEDSKAIQQQSRRSADPCHGSRRPADAMPDIDAIGERLAALVAEVMSDRHRLCRSARCLRRAAARGRCPQTAAAGNDCVGAPQLENPCRKW